jgi:tryptophan 2,3-dioxygenase
MGVSADIQERIELLEEKFRNGGQDMLSYLDGLLYDEYITYWDYIRLDTLLSLQVPKTHFPDEMIFIGYHQITEIYFKLIIHEQKQIADAEQLDVDTFIDKIVRINRYFTVLIDSFEVMIRGMEREQFQKFRMSLLPASGFQSAQFRIIEFYSTDVQNLIHPEARKELKDRFRQEGHLNDEEIELALDNLYWKKGGIDLTTGEKTLTLKQFEKKYNDRFERMTKKLRNSNIYQKYLQLPDNIRENEALVSAMKTLDQNANVNWLLMHMGAAHRYLRREGKAVEATGGTNWRDYLPPSFQKIIFFPSLWTEEDKENWGKQWVDHHLNTVEA